MIVAYAVHTHARPAQVSRLVRTLKIGSPESVVVVNHSRAGEPLNVDGLTSHPGVYVMMANGGYGDWSHVQRWLDCAEFLADRGIAYDWLTTLSGQDYPLMPLEESEAELAASGADGFIEHFPVLSREQSHWSVRMARSRYWFHHRRLRQLTPRQQEMLHGLQVLNFVQPLVRVHVSVGLSVGWRARTPYSRDFACYGGAAWTTLSRDCVEYIREFCRERPDIVHHYRRVVGAEESLQQTVLANAGRFRLIDDGKRYFDFRGSRFNRSRTLGLDDLPDAFTSGAHFGRKFDMESDPGILDTLDRRVLSRAL